MIVSHGIVVRDNVCLASSIVIRDSIDNASMNRPRCLDGVALISAYVGKTYHSGSMLAGVTNVVYSIVLSGCTKEYIPKCILRCIKSTTYVS